MLTPLLYYLVRYLRLVTIHDMCLFSAAHWNRYYREGQVSSYNPTRFDQPLDGMEWLAQFRKMNEVKLKQLDVSFHFL